MLECYDEALSFIQEYYIPSEDDTEYLLIMSYIYYKKTEYIQAIKYAQKMLHINELSFSINLHIFLAECFFKIGKYENCIFLLNSFVEHYKINPYDYKIYMLKI
jgi:tetratricopeptide (TPR) repeat protein